MTDFQTFLKWEARSRDTIDFKKAYVDMAGDVVAGLMLSQVVYWHLPTSAGEDKLRVERNGYRWLVKSREEWWDECRLNPREVDRARKILEDRGIIEVKLYKFSGAPTQHVRIREERFLELWQEVIEGDTSRTRKKFNRGGEGSGGASENSVPAGQGSAPTGLDVSDAQVKTPISFNESRPERVVVGEGSKRLKVSDAQDKSLISPISRIGEMHFTNRLNGFHQSVKCISRNSENLDTEITTEITTETTAAKPPAPRGPRADAALVDRLTGHGVGRRAAVQLVREKPDVCRRCLEYLPFAKFKTTKGAWLANAIRDEYGPPPGYEAERAREARERAAEKSDLARKTSQKNGEAMLEEKTTRLRVAYGQLEKSHGDDFRAFTDYVERERERTDRIALHLSPGRREELLAAFDTPERRLELFEAWTRTASAFLSQRPPSPEAASPHPG